MPVPTDTYWNIRRLNKLFAISAVILLLITVWTVLQDWNRAWKAPQRDAKVWEAALVSEKIVEATGGDYQAQKIKLEKEIADGLADLQQHNDQYKALADQIHQLDSKRQTSEFQLNNDKANLTVDESHLQDAITTGDKEKAEELFKQLEGPRKNVAAKTEELAAINADIKNAKIQQSQISETIDAKKKILVKKTGDVDLLNKKLNSLQPKGLFGQLSSFVRDQPLLQFVNPPEKPLQIVLPEVRTDVAFMKITTIDRCITCHVNISDKRFTKDNVIAYLEQQASVAKSLRLPDVAGGKAADPAATSDTPGAVALPEFWHGFATLIAPDVVRKNVARIGAASRLIGPVAHVTYDGQVVTTFKYDPATTDPKVVREQNDILLGVIDALSKYEGKGAVQTVHGGASVEIPTGADDKTVSTAKAGGLRYVEELRSGLKAALAKEDYDQIEDRYRHALIDFINPIRKKQGLGALDASPALLAHSNLDLYASPDSKHPADNPEKGSIGCTACHDGSGQETDFVLAAHTPRPILVDEKTGVAVLPSQVKRSTAEHSSKPTRLANMLEAVYPKDAVIPVSLSDIHLENHARASTQPSASSSENTDSAESDEPVDYVDPVTGQSGKAMTQMAYWIKTYEPIAPRSFELVYHEWDTPMRAPKFMQASCVRCHTDVYDIKEHAPVLAKGRELFVGLGCVDCHQMDSVPAYEKRRVGTDLRHVTSKLSPAMINTWIWAPKAFRPTTKMPHFFMLENNSSDEEIRRTKQEARSLTEYLVRTATPETPQFVIDLSMKGSAESGKKIFNSIGCQACHANLNDPTTDKRKLADGTEKVVTLGEKWITTDLPKNDAFVADVTQKLGKTPAAADLKKAAIAAYDSMTYNERQAYAQRHFEVDPGLHEAPKYVDGTPKPQFIHVGPELSGIGTKLTAGRTSEQARQWLYDWLKDPRHHSDYTIMPSLRLSDQQALDLVEYLLNQKRTNDSPNDPWEAHEVDPDTGKLIEMTAFFLRSRYSPNTAEAKAQDDTEMTALATDALTTKETPADKAKVLATALSPDEKRMVFLGKKLIGYYGCMGCHAINGTEDIASPCADLSQWGQKAVSKLDYGYLTDNTYEEFKAASQQRGAGEEPTTKIMLVNGLSAEVTHLLRGNGDIAKVSLASADTAAAAGVTDLHAQPVEASWFAVEHTRNDWIEHKLKNTRVYDRGRVLLEPNPAGGKDAKGVLITPGKPYDKIKMPTFYLNDEQVDAIITFVISNRDRLISEKLTNRATNPLADQIARGRELTTRYNCVSCHVIERNAPQVRQYYNPDDYNTKAPPSIRGEGNKIQHAWLFNFFKNVEPLRPLLTNGIRMPSFHATDDEFSSIITYFASVSNKESRQLKDQIDPVLKYISTETQAALKTDPNAVADPTKIWPGDDWYQRPEFQTTADMLKNWSLDLGQMRDVQFNATLNSKEEMARNWRAVLFKASFVVDLYDAPFPFVESPRPQITDERFHKGEQLFYEMQCLKCHVLGDPSVPGAQANPTAPNLGLAYRRLQRRWVRHWVQEPPIIQVNTAMPPFFTGLPVFDLKGQPWPKSQGAQPAEIDRVQALYGSTPDEQTGLLLDFLYAAGVRNYTGIQPGAAPAEKPATQPKPAAALTTETATTQPTTGP